MTTYDTYPRADHYLVPWVVETFCPLSRLWSIAAIIDMGCGDGYVAAQLTSHRATP